MSTLPQLFEEDVLELNRAMQELLDKCEAGNAFIIDKGGFLIAERGEPRSLDTTTLAALSAASYAATQGIANLVNEPNFNSVYQQGEASSLLVMNVDEHCLLAVLFRAQVSVGAVKYFGQATIQKIAQQLQQAHERNPEAALDLSKLNLADPSPLFQRKSALS